MSLKRFEGDNPLPWLQKQKPEASVEETIEAPLPGDPAPVWVEHHKDQSDLENQFSDDLIEEEQEEVAAEDDAPDIDLEPSKRQAGIGQLAHGTPTDQDGAPPAAASVGPVPSANGGIGPSDTTSTRLRLSEILREAELQRKTPASVATAPPLGSPATSRQAPAAPAPSGVQAEPLEVHPVAQEEYPSLLERPRDGKTEPFLDMMPEARADDVDQDFRELDSLPKAKDPLAEVGPAPYVAPPPSRERRFQNKTAGHIPWKVVSIVVLGLALAAFIGVFAAWVLTAEDSADEVNRRIAAELTEVDRYLATNQEAISQAEPNEDGRVPLPDYPLPISLSQDEARLPQEELREVILDDAAALMYSDGVEAYGADSGVFDDFSTPGLVRFGTEMMRESSHNTFLVLSILFGLITVAAAAGVFAATSGGGRLAALGIGVTLAGGIALIGSLIMRFVFDRAASREDDDLANGLGDIATDVSFVFTRNSLAFLAVGIVILTAGFVLRRLDREEQTAVGSREPANVS